MKVRWRSALMSFTMAPATGCPAASFTTPATTLRLSAAWAATAIAPNATPAARYLEKVFSVMRFPPSGYCRYHNGAPRWCIVFCSTSLAGFSSRYCRGPVETILTYFIADFEGCFQAHAPVMLNHLSGVMAGLVPAIHVSLSGVPQERRG